mmetsp:Transcript_24340/g.31686  ORF Transcript_24340/g.31686 Transcript_24340/m.31686 type:complete len:190 (-) Transcript_24340:357-926(-)
MKRSRSCQEMMWKEEMNTNGYVKLNEVFDDKIFLLEAAVSKISNIQNEKRSEIKSSPELVQVMMHAKKKVRNVLPLFEKKVMECMLTLQDGSEKAGTMLIFENQQNNNLGLSLRTNCLGDLSLCFFYKYTNDDSGLHQSTPPVTPQRQIKKKRNQEPPKIDRRRRSWPFPSQNRPYFPPPFLPHIGSFD